MAEDERRTSDAQLAILAELLQTEISIHGVAVSIELVQRYPGAALVRNELGIVLELAKQGGVSVAALRDLIWLEFGVIGAAGDA
jgi:hypothetical protein